MSDWISDVCSSDLKRDLGLMDFSDQIELGARLAAERPEVGALEREKFTVVLLDEYQDTSVAQALMLSRLFSGPTAGHGLGPARSQERRVGQECVRTCEARWSPSLLKKTTHT